MLLEALPSWRWRTIRRPYGEEPRADPDPEALARVEMFAGLDVARLAAAVRLVASVQPRG